ncbi:MAG: PAS domain S-box protein [Candidatus Omnitrophica bacterium]|nr:PAS domain S-box protein [Candidatus Omnitrophota bacterium]
MTAETPAPSSDEISVLNTLLDQTQTELSLARQELLRSDEYFHSLIQNSLDVIFVLEPDGCVRYTSPSAERILGYQPQRLAKRCIFEFIDPYDLPKMLQAFNRSVCHPQAIESETFHFLKQDGTRRFVEAIFNSLLENPAMEGVVLNIHDITDLNQAQNALKSAADELARSNQELEQFAYAASHDLQEPLRKVASYTQLLGDTYKGKLDGEADKFIGYVVDGVVRMQALIKDLLLYSRVGRGEMTKEPISMDAVVSQVLSTLEIRIRETQAVVTKDPLPTVPVNRSQIEQLMQNLIGNAVKYHGEAAPRIHVSAQRRGTHWVFSVRDNGIGIDPQHYDRVFVIFQRLHTRTQYEGTGIGLAICKKIVERHGGKIWVESKPGEGSTFLFTVPAS